MFPKRRWKLKRLLVSDLYTLFDRISRPAFFLCFPTVFLPSCLLCILCGWKSMFFPGVLPHLPWLLFLPLYLLLTAGIPSVGCAVLLSLPHGSVRALSRILLPALTYHLLVSDLYLLLLLYHAPYFFCILSALAMCISAAVNALYLRHLSCMLGIAAGFTLLFDAALFFLTCAF